MSPTNQLSPFSMLNAGTHRIGGYRVTKKFAKDRPPLSKKPKPPMFLEIPKEVSTEYLRANKAAGIRLDRLEVHAKEKRRGGFANLLRRRAENRKPGLHVFKQRTKT